MSDAGRARRPPPAELPAWDGAWSTARAATSTSRGPGPSSESPAGGRASSSSTTSMARSSWSPDPVDRRWQRVRPPRAGRRSADDAGASRRRLAAPRDRWLGDGASTSSPPTPRSRPRRRASAALEAGGLPRPSRRSSRRATGSAWPAPAAPMTRRSVRGIAKSTRQRVARRRALGVVVVATTRPAGTAATRFEGPDRPPRPRPSATGSRPLLGGPASGAASVRAREAFIDWWRGAQAAGLLVYLEARDDRRGDVSAGSSCTATATASRRSTRPTPPGVRDSHPGVMHLLRWRAIQLAIREGRTEMDLGGVDVGPDHREPAGATDGRAVRAQAVVRGALGRDGRRARAGHPPVALRARSAHRQARARG